MVIISSNNLTKYDEIEEKIEPTFVIGNVYTLQVDLNVRRGAGTNFNKKAYNELTEDGKNHAYKSENAVLKKGTRVTCLDIIIDKFNNIWFKIPSGYVAAFYEGKEYVK